MAADKKDTIGQFFEKWDRLQRLRTMFNSRRQQHNQQQQVKYYRDLVVVAAKALKKRDRELELMKIKVYQAELEQPTRIIYRDFTDYHGVKFHPPTYTFGNTTYVHQIMQQQTEEEEG